MLDQGESRQLSQSPDIQTLISRIKAYAQQQQASPAPSHSGNTKQTQADFNRIIGECLWFLTEYIRDIQTRLQFTDGWQQLETERNATVTQRVTDDLKALTALEKTVNQENHRLNHHINCLSAELQTLERTCATYQRSVDLVKRDQALQAEVHAQAHRQLVSRLARLDSRLSQQLSALAASFSHIQDDHLAMTARIDELRGVDYFLFAQRFRGSRADVKQRQLSYTHLFLERERVLDLGCGRGEFLEILSEQGISGTGIDADKHMVECCRKAGLDVRQCDMFEYLKSCPANAFDGMFSAQVIEHLPVHKIVELLSLCASKIRPGGIILLETVNPVCPTALSNFYLDPTHVRPVHPELLLFLLDGTPFKLQDIRFSSPVEHICADGGLTIPFRIGDQPRMPSTIANYQDYATIALKP